MGFTQEDMAKAVRSSFSDIEYKDSFIAIIYDSLLPRPTIFDEGKDTTLVTELKSLRNHTHAKSVSNVIYHMVCDIKYYEKHKRFSPPDKSVKEDKADYEAIVALAEAVIEEFSKDPTCIQEDNLLAGICRDIGIMKPRKITLLLERYTSELCADSAFA